MSLRLVLDRVSHRYGELVVLDDVSVTAEPGEVTVLVGPSGCGKSTLLGIAGGLIRPTAGAARTEGGVPDDCVNPLTYVFQDFSLLPWRTVEGNVAFPLEHAGLGRPERQRRVGAALASMNLQEFARAWPRQLSGGMRQRVGIARALVVRPACLLMDEPLSALDGQTRSLLLDEFVALMVRTGTTVLYVTHNLAEATRLGHAIVILSRRPGRVRHIVRIDRALTERRDDDPDLVAARRDIWAMIRGDAVAADRETAVAAH